MKRSIKRDDQAVVIRGALKPNFDKDNLKRINGGKVLKVDRKKNQVIIEGVNVHRVTRKRTATEAGGLIEKERPIHISNVMRREEYERRMEKQGQPVGEMNKGEKVTEEAPTSEGKSG